MNIKPISSTYLSVCLIASILALGNGCSHNSTKNTIAENQEPRSLGEESFIGSSKVKRFQLANGLKILILEDHAAPTFSFHTWYDVGSRDEQKGLTGLAHLFEHMMFKATSNYPEGVFDRMMEQAGAENKNAFTSRDYTAYVQSLPTSQLDLVASLEADRMVNLLVNDQSLDKERDVVKNERRFRNENSPDGTLYERLNETAYKNHPYHWPVIGYEKDLNNAKAKECLSFYHNHYSPNNATIVIAGDVNPNKAVATINKYYGHLSPQQVQHYKGPAEPMPTKERKETLKLAISVEKLYIAYHVPSLNHADIPALEIFNNILGHTNSSRLYQKLVDAGIATSVDTFHDSHKDSGLVIIVVNMQKGRKASAALSVIDAEISKLAKGSDLNVDDIQTAKAQYKYELYEELESNFNKAKSIGFFEIVAGKFSRGPEIVKLLDTVTTKDITNVVKKYFVPSHRTVLLGVPKGKTK